MNEHKPPKPKIGNEINNLSVYSYVPTRQARRLLVMRSELIRVRSKQMDNLRAQIPKATQEGIRTAQVNNLSNTLAYGLLIVTILTAIAATTSLINWAFLVYGIIVIAIKLPSQRIFTAALISLVLIPLTTLLNRNGLANDFAVVAFYFMLVGSLRAILEVRRDASPEPSK